MVGGIVKLLALVVGVVATDVLITWVFYNVLFLITRIYSYVLCLVINLERRRCSLQWKGLEGKSIYIISGVYVSHVIRAHITCLYPISSTYSYNRHVTMRSVGQTPVVGVIRTSSVFPTITSTLTSKKKRKYPLTTLIQTQPTMLMKRSRWDR